MKLPLPLAYTPSLLLGSGSITLLVLILAFQKSLPEPVLISLCLVTGLSCGLSAGSLLFPASSTIKLPHAPASDKR
jgi:hydrogenase/urease accessory protein HupE